MKISLCFSVLLLFLATSVTYAGSATWNLTPTSGDWNTSANWTPAIVPNGLTDTATFDFSNVTDVTVSASTTLDGIVFNPGATAFTITDSDMQPLTFEGAGIVNSSGVPQTFVSLTSNFPGSISFHNQASAGTDTYFVSLADTQGFGNVNFHDNSSASTATFTNNGSDHGLGGSTFFFDHSSAAQATLINNGNPTASKGGYTVFFGGSTAAEATIICKGGVLPNIGGGYAEVEAGADAGNATFTADGGTGSGTQGGIIQFFSENAANATLVALDGTDGGEGGLIEFFFSPAARSTARIELFGNSTLFFLQSVIALGSVEGRGNIEFSGEGSPKCALTVGLNNRSTTCSGIISGKGSLTLAGSASLTLTGANTYTLGTTIEAGKLVVNNRTGSGTGTGPVQVNAGQLAGRGIIAGAVVVGTGSGGGATLAPGQSKGRQNTLTIEGALTFNSDGTYECGVNTKSVLTDKVVANGVTINGGRITVREPRGFPLTPGTVLTVIDNTSANPTSGTFSNLPDNAIFAVGQNTYQASYSGGEGNDLTLTVVP